jgi:hypothetical protein
MKSAVDAILEHRYPGSGPSSRAAAIDFMGQMKQLLPSLRFPAKDLRGSSPVGLFEVRDHDGTAGLYLLDERQRFEPRLPLWTDIDGVYFRVHTLFPEEERAIEKIARQVASRHGVAFSTAFVAVENHGYQDANSRVAFYRTPHSHLQVLGA